jgi:hypothetical protein
MNVKRCFRLLWDVRRCDVARTFAVDAGQDVEGVVGEEAAVVQRVAQQLRHGGGADLLLLVVLVPGWTKTQAEYQL